MDEALRWLLQHADDIHIDHVQTLVDANEVIPSATDVVVEEPDLDSFDSLLDDKEVFDVGDTGCEGGIGWTSAGTASAYVP